MAAGRFPGHFIGGAGEQRRAVGADHAGQVQAGGLQVADQDRDVPALAADVCLGVKVLDSCVVGGVVHLGLRRSSTGCWATAAD
ncbi:hypothetical protein G6F24_016754 [Rhizopus arrhizus]|nr:hypothetical protein G6F24_016754 [Rhizopus arrhizus]